jgi:hypothetical protein
MINPEALTRARVILASGASLREAANAVGWPAAELDVMLWSAGSGTPVAPRKPPQRRKRRPIASCRPWTGAEQKRLRAYFRDGVPVWVIAEVFQRTEAAIFGRARQLKLRHKLSRRSREAGRAQQAPAAAA